MLADAKINFVTNFEFILLSQSCDDPSDFLAFASSAKIRSFEATKMTCYVFSILLVHLLSFHLGLANKIKILVNYLCTFEKD